MNSSEFFDPEEFAELEQDVVDLQSRLEGVQAAELTSVPATKLVAYIQERQEEDLFVMGEEENRWKELIVKEEVEVEKPAQKGCCAVQ